MMAVCVLVQMWHFSLIEATAIEFLNRLPDSASSWNRINHHPVFNYKKVGAQTFWSAIRSSKKGKAKKKKNLPEPNGYNMELFLSFYTEPITDRLKKTQYAYKNQIASIKPVLLNVSLSRGKIVAILKKYTQNLQKQPMRNSTS